MKTPSIRTRIILASITILPLMALSLLGFKNTTEEPKEQFKLLYASPNLAPAWNMKPLWIYKIKDIDSGKRYNVFMGIDAVSAVEIIPNVNDKNE